MRILILKSVPMSGRPHLRLELVTDKNGVITRRYHRTMIESIGDRVETARSATDMISAKAYWDKHFVNGSPHKILCRYGTKTYAISVTFVRNHAYTEDVLKTGRDDLREFASARARNMHWIWHVLSSPKHVNPSDTNKKNKQLDAEISKEGIELDGGQYGRVILKPTPTAAELAKGVATHNFEFVSWHLPSEKAWKAAGESAKRKWTTPVEMKKAHCFQSAFPLFLDHQPNKAQARPASCVPQSIFTEQGCRKSLDSNSLAESSAIVGQTSGSRKRNTIVLFVRNKLS